MQTVVVFHRRNTQGRAGGHPIASSTLGKKGLIEYSWRPLAGQQMPQGNELWRVQIIRETNPGENRGCLILQPIRKVEPAEMRYLVPGTYTERWENDGKTLIATPKIGQGTLSPQEVEYMFPKDLKTLFRQRGVNCFVINLGGEYWVRDLKAGADKEASRGQNSNAPDRQ